jgi:hypothetical protein
MYVKRGRGNGAMKIGVIYPQTELQGDPEAVRRIGLATEELGYDHLLVYDHVLGATHDREPKLTGPYTEKQPFHDPFVMFVCPDLRLFFSTYGSTPATLVPKPLGECFTGSAQVR